MVPDPLLTQDELDFLRSMQNNPQLNVRDASSSLTLKGGSQIRQLLTRLAAHEQVTIEAHFENRQISFPLHLVEDEFHAAHLEVGAPSIYEDGPVLRPWRLALDPPVALENDVGQPTHLWVREISFKGVLLEPAPDTEPPQQFCLWFHPEDHEPMALRGTLIRKTEQHRVAYRLSQGNAQDTEQLRQYIGQQLSLIHPQLHD